MVTTSSKASSSTSGPAGSTQPPAAAAAEGSLLVLGGKDVDSILSSLDPKIAIESQRQVFTAFSTSHSASSSSSASGPAEIEVPHRAVLSSDKVTSLFMPSRSPIGTGIKIVSVPSAGSDGLPATTMLLDQDTGRVKGIVNARKLTALRNAAGSALFLQTFPCPKPPQNLVVFGTGAQAYAHIVMLVKLYPSIKQCTIVARSSSSRATSLLRDLQSLFSDVAFTLGISDPTAPTSSSSSGSDFDLSQTVHNANIILTLTPSTTALFNSVDVTSHTRLVLVGSYKPEMREVEDDLIRRAGKTVVDSKEACGKEAGELISAGVGNEGMVELGECLDPGKGDMVKKQVEERGDIVIFKSVGIGLQDIAIAKVIFEQATKKGLGTVIQNYD